VIQKYCVAAVDAIKEVLKDEAEDIAFLDIHSPVAINDVDKSAVGTQVCCGLWYLDSHWLALGSVSFWARQVVE
jgi:hypothetical protein